MEKDQGSNVLLPSASEETTIVVCQRSPWVVDKQMVLPSEDLGWPKLSKLKICETELSARTTCIGGSDANVILSGSADATLRLWKEKRGEAQPEDLSSKLPVMLGCWTEPFNRQWYEQATGERVSQSGMTLRCSTYDWRRCTLDGFIEARGAVWEAKHTSAFAKNDEVLARYMPQLQHNMAVAKADRAFLSVIFGNHKWKVFEVAADWLYQDELLSAEEQFWYSVMDGVPPTVAASPPPPKPVGVQEICLEGNNLWAASAADWLQHREAARKHAAAATAIRDMLEPDVSRAFGHGIEAKRSKAGAVTIRELAE